MARSRDISECTGLAADLRSARSRTALSVVAAGVVAIIVVVAVAGVAYVSLSKSSTSSTTGSTASTISQTSISVTTHSFSIPQSSFTTSSSTTTQTFSNSTGNASLAGQLVITKVVGDINSSDQQQVLYSLYYNETEFSGNLPFVGNPGQTFWLQVDLQFAACPCVGEVSSVTSSTPGFTVSGFSPALPEQFSGIGGDYYDVGFWIQVKAPSTPYNGTLTLIDTIA